MARPFNYELFNLEPRDLRVYETLHQYREVASIRAIAEEIGLNYGTTYEVIKKLQKMGLVSAQQKLKRKYYTAERPEKLQAYASERHLAMGRELDALVRYTKELETLKQPSTAEQCTKFYDGEEEVAALLTDVLTTMSKIEPKQYQVFSSAEVRNHLYAKFRNFTRRRIQLGIEVQVIGIGKAGRKAKLAVRRQLAVAHDNVPAAYVIIYGDKVAQLSLPETGYIQGVVVQDAAVAALQRVVFRNLWSRSWNVDDPKF